jgi:hypothetical protein
MILVAVRIALMDTSPFKEIIMDVDQFIRGSGLNLPKVGQLGIITPGIHGALPGVASAFNLHNWYEPQYAEKQFIIQGERVELDFNLVFAYSGGLQIELIEESSHIYRSPPKAGSGHPPPWFFHHRHRCQTGAS